MIVSCNRYKIPKLSETLFEVELKHYEKYAIKRKICRTLFTK